MYQVLGGIGFCRLRLMRLGDDSIGFGTLKVEVSEDSWMSPLPSYPLWGISVYAPYSGYLWVIHYPRIATEHNK